MEFLIFSLFGCVAGLLSGLLPSISPTVVMVIAYPVLLNFTAIDACVFFISCLVVSQYTGSVVATLLGIPGEASSLQALTEGYAMARQGLANLALKISAVGSFVGSLIALIIAVIIIPFSKDIFVFFVTEVKLFFVIVCFITCVVFINNSRTANFLLLAFGFFLSLIGPTRNNYDMFLTFGNEYLATGIPFLYVFIFLYALPQFLKFKNVNIDINLLKNKSADSGTMPWYSMIYGSIIGFFAGLIPGLSYIAGSQLSWAAEKYRCGKDYKPGNPFCLAAAETANNAGTLSCLIPLFIFGVPILGSEAVLYKLCEQLGVKFGASWFYDTNVMYWTAASFIVANIFGLMIAWPWAQKCVKLVFNNYKLINTSSLAILWVIPLYDAITSFLPMYHLLVAITLGVIGFLLRRFELLPLIFGFLLGPLTINSIDIFIQKHL